MTLSNIFTYFFKWQRMKYQLLALIVHDLIKTLSRTFSLYFFKPQRLKYQLLAFLVHYVINHFPVPFETTTFEISVICFSSTWRYTNIFPYFFPVVFQTTTFEISVTTFSSTWRNKTFSRTFSLYFFKPQRLKYQLLAFLVDDVIKQFLVLFSNHNVWNISYLLF